MWFISQPYVLSLIKYVESIKKILSNFTFNRNNDALFRAVFINHISYWKYLLPFDSVNCVIDSFYAIAIKFLLAWIYNIYIWVICGLDRVNNLFKFYEWIHIAHHKTNRQLFRFFNLEDIQIELWCLQI